MKQCEKCISLNRYPAPDAEVIGSPVNDAPPRLCPALPLLEAPPPRLIPNLAAMKPG